MAEFFAEYLETKFKLTSLEIAANRTEQAIVGGKRDSKPPLNLPAAAAAQSAGQRDLGQETANRCPAPIIDPEGDGQQRYKRKQNIDVLV